MNPLSMTFSRPTTSLPFNYKPKKFHHMVYLDIENVGISDGFVEKTLSKLKLMELTISCAQRYTSLIETIKQRCKISSSMIYPIIFDTPEKDKADNFLLSSMNRDGTRFSKHNNVVFFLISNDKKLQRKFIDNAINHGVGYKIEGHQ